jgi:hypothetical protein
VTLDLTSKGIDYGRITAFSDGTVDTSQVQGVNPDLRVRPLFAEGRDFSLRVLAMNAWMNAMGLIAEDPDFAAAAATPLGRVVTPSDMVLDGSLDTFPAPPAPRPECGEADSEIPVSLVDFMEFYLLHYFKPGTYQQTLAFQAGSTSLPRLPGWGGFVQCGIQPQARNTADKIGQVADPPQQGDHGETAIGDGNQRSRGQPAPHHQEHLSRPVGQLLVPLASFLMITLGGR